MTDYFEYSQSIKREIESQPRLMDTLREHMYEQSEAEEIGESSSNTIFRIGELESGLWVALRQRGGYMINIPHYLQVSRSMQQIYESYAEGAEYFSSRGKRVPFFCIGVHTAEESDYPNSALLVEDLTTGGAREISLPQGSMKGTFTDDRTEVYVDLDNDFPEHSPLKYMDRKNSIIV